VLLGEVKDVDPDAKRIRLADGAELEYDSLIVAARSHYDGNDSWSQWAPGMKSIEEATEIRHKILYAFEVAERLPTPRSGAPGSLSSSWEPARRAPSSP
jgi:NADH dehydrogenase